MVNVNGAPVERELLARMTRAMAFRGPDAEETWVSGPVGFGHALLQTTDEPGRRTQPCTVDGQEWIVADARVDGQAELRRMMSANGITCPPGISDAELILYAYRAWGDDCVRYLVGDFSFSIWDRRRERLFCARDHFGVKPFYYAKTGGSLVFSNTLNSVRQHPHVADGLNDTAIADFLVFGINQDESSTAFAGINRLPPAHRMSWSHESLQVTRYWDLPDGSQRRYSRESDYVEHFLDTLRAAVTDRLRNSRIGILMSGGLDSTSIAVVAKALLSDQNDDFDLRAYACVYDRLFVDEERHFADLAARALKIPIHHLVADDYALFERWETPALRRPEPADEPMAAIYLDQMAQAAAHGRVVLTGWDGDALLGEESNVSGGVVGRCMRFARAGCRALLQRRWPGANVLAKMNRVASRSPHRAFECPEWLNPDLVKRLDLSTRWRERHNMSGACAHAHREAHRVLKSPLLTNLLECYDPGVTRIPVEARHPLLDVRVVEYVLSLPVSPWCIDKHLLRMSMRGHLPESVRRRPKTPLAGDPVIEILRHGDDRCPNAFEPAPLVDKYVDPRAVPPLTGTQSPDQTWTDLRPWCLNLWLQQQAEGGGVPSLEERHEIA